MNRTENTKILITMMKQTEEYSWIILQTLPAYVKNNLLNHGGPSQRHSIKPQPTCERFMKRLISFLNCSEKLDFPTIFLNL